MPMTKTEAIAYANRWIRNSAISAFSHLHLNTLLLEIIEEAYSGGGGGGGDVTVEWADIEGLISGNAALTAALAAKADVSHTQAISTITGLQAAIDGKAAVSHTHSTADVTGLDTALSGKAATSHTHSTSDVTGLDTALAGKANTSHTHTTSQVTGLDSALAAKSDVGHTHLIENVVNLQAALDAKAATSHTHTASQIIDFASAVQVAAPAETGIDIRSKLETLSGSARLDASAIKNLPSAGGTGAVDSVNGQTGIVSLNQDNITDGTTYKQYSQTDKTKLAGIATAATANSTDASLRDRATHTGLQAISTVTGLQTALDSKVAVDGSKVLSDVNFTTAKDTKLTGIATGATANSPDATLLARANHTGTQSTDTLTEGTAKLLTAAERTKLAGVATGATANSTDAQLRDRSTHTGTQSATTITGLSTVATSGAYTDLTGRPTIPVVSDVAYDATTWNGNTDAPSKNAVRDKIESIISGIAPDSETVTYTNPTSGAFARSVESRLSDELWIEDFRDGDDTDADVWEKALAAMNTLKRPLRATKRKYTFNRTLIYSGSYWNVKGENQNGSGTEIEGAITGFERITATTTADTSYGTTSAPGPMRGAAFYITSLIDYPVMENIVFYNLRFGMAHYWPMNSVQFKNISFLTCNVGIFCYQGSQNYNYIGCNSAGTNVIHIAGATCFPSGHPQAGLDNFYADGLTIKNEGGYYGQLGVVENTAFDNWFVASILRPSTNSVVSTGTFQYKNQAGTTYADNDPMYCMPSGRVAFLPMRNPRTVFGPTFMNLDVRTLLKKGFALINHGIVGLRIEGSLSFEQTFLGDSTSTPYFTLGAVHNGLLAVTYTNLNGAFEPTHPLIGWSTRGYSPGYMEYDKRLLKSGLANRYLNVDVTKGVEMPHFDSGERAAVSSPVEGTVQWDWTVDKLFVYSDLTSTWKPLVDESTTQTLTNKTIDGDLNTVQDLPASAIKSSEKQTLDITALATNDTAKAEIISVAMSDLTTAITAGVNKAYFRMPWAGTLTAVKATALTAPTGSTIIIDINESGTTVLSTKLSIDASEKTSTTAASAAVISDAALASDAEITFDFDQVGSTVAGAGIIVYLYINRA